MSITSLHRLHTGAAIPSRCSTPNNLPSNAMSAGCLGIKPKSTTALPIARSNTPSDSRSNAPSNAPSNKTLNGRRSSLNSHSSSARNSKAESKNRKKIVRPNLNTHFDQTWKGSHLDHVISYVEYRVN